MYTHLLFAVSLIALLAAARFASPQHSISEGLLARLSLLRRRHMPIPPAGLLLFALFQLMIALVISSGICTGALPH